MRLLLRAGLLLGLATAVACKESLAPKSLANPQATTAQMEAIDTLFNFSALNSFSAVSGSISPSAPARVSALRALAAAANPLNKSSALRPYAAGVETSDMLRQLIPTLTSASSASLFPPDVIGKTFEWNTTTSMYAATARAGAPSNGVRFILYAVDPLTSQPAIPLVEVGYVDLMDESSGNTSKIHVVVAGVGGTPVYIDYTVAVQSTSATSASIAASGYITRAADSPDTLRFNGSVAASATQTGATVTQDVKLDVNSRDLHLRVWEKVIFTQTTLTLRVWFSFQHGTEIVTLEGRLDVNQSTQEVSGTVTAKVNGGLFATCTVNATSSSYSETCQGADADGLNADEQEALQHLGNGLDHLSALFSGILGPPSNILGAGI